MALSRSVIHLKETCEMSPYLVFKFHTYQADGDIHTFAGMFMYVETVKELANMYLLANYCSKLHCFVVLEIFLKMIVLKLCHN